MGAVNAGYAAGLYQHAKQRSSTKRKKRGGSHAALAGAGYGDGYYDPQSGYAVGAAGYYQGYEGYTGYAGGYAGPFDLSLIHI